MSEIIERREETKILNDFIHSKTSEFLALYGRRRIGKTFLIKNFFKNKKLIFFNVTGEKDASIKNQIKHFTKQISDVFYHGAQLALRKNWDESFEMLTESFKKIGKKKLYCSLTNFLGW